MHGERWGALMNQKREESGKNEESPPVFERRRRQILLLQNWLQQIWLEPDPRRRMHGVFWILHRLFNPLAGIPKRSLRTNALYGQMRNQIPPVTFIEEALFQLLKNSEGAKFCANPDCPTPFFFATRPTQKYCSAPCGKPAQLAAKRRWWREEGRMRRTSGSSAEVKQTLNASKRTRPKKGMAK